MKFLQILILLLFGTTTLMGSTQYSTSLGMPVMQPKVKSFQVLEKGYELEKTEIGIFGKLKKKLKTFKSRLLMAWDVKHDRRKISKIGNIIQLVITSLILIATYIFILDRRRLLRNKNVPLEETFRPLAYLVQLIVAYAVFLGMFIWWLYALIKLVSNISKTTEDVQTKKVEKEKKEVEKKEESLKNSDKIIF